LIQAIVIAAYTGWAAYASLFIYRPQIDTLSPHARFVTPLAMLILLAFWGVFAIQRSPWTFYLYILFPVFFWQQCLIRAFQPLRVWLLSVHPTESYLKLVLNTGLVWAALQCMVVRA